MTDELITSDIEEAAPLEKLTGISVYPGTAFGLCQIFTSGDMEVPQFSIEKSATRGEIQRLRAAINTVDKQLAGLADSFEDDMPPEAEAFVEVHRTILRDRVLIEDTIDIIKEKLINAEWALSIRLEKTRREFEAIDDDYIRERVNDFAYVILRVQRVLTGRRSEASLLNAEGIDEKYILVAESLDPADVLQLRERNGLEIVGIVLEEGSRTSHVAILARSLEIPTLVGVENARELLQNEQPILIDADNNVLELDPTPARRREARTRMRELADRRKRLRKLKMLDAVTLDGHTINLHANIALPDDASWVRRSGADGVGLFRTEFLFLNREDLPSETEQYEAYAKVIRSMKGEPVIIRTADLGGDKMLPDEIMEKLNENYAEECNPALGLRGLRFSFSYPEVFVTQLKAILRAATSGNVSILLPMITCPEDVEKVRGYIDQAKAELDEEGVRHADKIRLGGMIEIPSAIIMLRDLIPVLDFFSLGTNDLIQYTLAVDRTNASVSTYYDERHPSVLRLIAECIRRCTQAGKKVSVCGEMAARKELLPFFIGLGCKDLSMTWTQIPDIKERILQTDLAKAEQFANSVLRRRSIKAIHASFDEFEKTFEKKGTAQIKQ